MSAAKWHDLWRMYFWKISSEELAIWESELLSSIRDLTIQEIEDAVRDLSFENRRSNPTGKHLRAKIYTNRKERGQDSEDRPAGCPHCRDLGWVATTEHPDYQEWHGHKVDIPCVCAKGDGLRERYTDNSQREEMVRMAHGAVQQQKER